MINSHDFARSSSPNMQSHSDFRLDSDDSSAQRTINNNEITETQILNQVHQFLPASRRSVKRNFKINKVRKTLMMRSHDTRSPTSEMQELAQGDHEFTPIHRGQNFVVKSFITSSELQNSITQRDGRLYTRQNDSYFSPRNKDNHEKSSKIKHNLKKFFPQQSLVPPSVEVYSPKCRENSKTTTAIIHLDRS